MPSRLTLTEDADDYEEIASKAEHRGYDNSPCGKDFGAESQLSTARTSHQKIACGYEKAGNEENTAWGKANTCFNAALFQGVQTVGHNGHIAECIVGK